MEYIVAAFKAWMQKIRVFVSRISPPLEQRNVFNIFVCARWRTACVQRNLKVYI